MRWRSTLGGFPFALTSLDDLPALIPRLREQFRWVQELPVHWSRDLDYYLIRLGEFMAEPLEDKSTGRALAFRQGGQRARRAVFPAEHRHLRSPRAVLYRLLQFLLGQLFGPAEVAPLMDGLLAFCETKTGAINKELYELAQMVRRDPPLEKRLRVPDGSRALWDSGLIEREHAAFHQRFRAVPAQPRSPRDRSRSLSPAVGGGAMGGARPVAADPRRARRPDSGPAGAGTEVRVPGG